MTALAVTKIETFDCRQAFAETLIELAHSDSRIVAVCNDSVGSSNLVQFQKLFPERLINAASPNRTWSGSPPASLMAVSFLSFAERRRF